MKIYRGQKEANFYSAEKRDFFRDETKDKPILISKSLGFEILGHQHDVKLISQKKLF
jgi:hypothetical protein